MDEILSVMISKNNVKCFYRIVILCTNFITVKRGEISRQFEQIELKLSFPVIKLKIIM